jgi:hypothetical protein
MSENKETTSVETVDMDLDQILNIGDSVMLPSTGSAEPVKQSLFSRKTEDLSFLDKPEKMESAKAESTEPGKSESAAAAAPSVSKQEVDDLINMTAEEDETKKTGRPTLQKEGLVELTSKLIEKGLLVPFQNDKGEDEDISKYSLKDFEELIEANFSDKEEKLGNEVTKDFFKALPEEFQFAYKYINDGGTDLKSLFRTLAQVEEVRQMDPGNEGDAKHIVRSYLQATNFGTVEEIEEEIVAWDDRGEIEAKAAKFKPKLDAMTERQVAYKLQQQEALRHQQAEQAQHYMDSVYKILEPGDLNGIKLDRKTQNLLFTGLTQVNYPSVSGRPTNLLGHLLEKYQYVEPNHSLLSEALWLLADPDGYKSKVRENNKKEVVAETVRKLKSEEKNKIASYTPDDETPAKTGPRLSRTNTSGFFKR